jgi:hypothetical protein
VGWTVWHFYLCGFMPLARRGHRGWPFVVKAESISRIDDSDALRFLIGVFLIGGACDLHASVMAGGVGVYDDFHQVFR